MAQELVDFLDPRVLGLVLLRVSHLGELESITDEWNGTALAEVELLIIFVDHELGDLVAMIFTVVVRVFPSRYGGRSHTSGRWLVSSRPNGRQRYFVAIAIGLLNSRRSIYTVCVYGLIFIYFLFLVMGSCSAVGLRC